MWCVYFPSSIPLLWKWVSVKHLLRPNIHQVYLGVAWASLADSEQSLLVQMIWKSQQCEVLPPPPTPPVFRTAKQVVTTLSLVPWYLLFCVHVYSRSLPISDLFWRPLITKLLSVYFAMLPNAPKPNPEPKWLIPSNFYIVLLFISAKGCLYLKWGVLFSKESIIGGI